MQYISFCLLLGHNPNPNELKSEEKCANWLKDLVLILLMKNFEFSHQNLVWAMRLKVLACFEIICTENKIMNSTNSCCKLFPLTWKRSVFLNSWLQHCRQITCELHKDHQSQAQYECQSVLKAIFKSIIRQTV